MKKLELVLRYLLGAMMLIFGANVFLHFIPMEPPPENAQPFMGALEGSGYIMPLMGSIYVLSGIAMVINRCVGLALVMLAPISVNAFLFHVGFAVPGTVPSVIFNLLVFGLIGLHRDRFMPLLK